MSKILITGAGGFVGSRLTKKLRNKIDVLGEAKHTVYAMDGREAGNILWRELPEEVDVIYHLAAHKSVEESWEFPMLYAENLEMIQRLVHTYPKAKLIHASSCAGDWPVASPYGFFKFAASKYLEAFHTNYVDLVFPNIYGGLQKQNSVVDTFKNAEEITIQGDGSIIRDYVHVDDIVSGLVKAKNWPIGRYSLGSGIPTNTMALAAATGKKITFAPARSGGKEPQESVVPNTTPNWAHTINVLEYVSKN